MAEKPQDALAAGLRRLLQSSLPELERRLSVVESAATAKSAGKLTDELRMQAHREAHKLAGVLGTYGLQDASRAAHDLEVMLEDAATMEMHSMTEKIGFIRGEIVLA